MNVPVAGITDVGRVRQRNEDQAVLGPRLVGGASDEHVTDLVVPAVVAVLDGMGGHPAGDVASRLAAEVLSEAAPPTATEEIEEIVNAMQERLYDAMAEQPETRRMGTTVVLASVLDEHRALVAGVGDSSAYWFDDDGLALVVAEDRSVAGWITQCIGGTVARDRLRPHVGEVSGPGRLLLCTDGVADVVAPTDVEGILRDAVSVKDVVHDLAGRALEAGGPDNVTAVALDLEG